jgi:Polysaccharide pyruvyl transferase
VVPGNEHVGGNGIGAGVAGAHRVSPAGTALTLRATRGYVIAVFPPDARRPVMALQSRPVVKVLVAGWFSFEHGHATAGDLLARDLVCEWLAGAGYPYDIAVAAPFRDGIDLREARPEAYSHAVFVCGPFERKALEAEFLGRFARSFVMGVNLTMITPLDVWNPFDVLFERDSSVDAHADIVFLSTRRKVPIVGRCLVEPYAGALDAVANAAIARLLRTREAAVVEIDTRLDRNATGLRTPAEVESLVARMDVVVTTRLHGMVLALKNGVPVIAIDPEAGGAKIKRQAATVAWPVAFTADNLSDDNLQKALDYCLTDDARQKARQCGRNAADMVAAMRAEFVAAVRGGVAGRPAKRSEREAFAASFTASATGGHTGGDGFVRRAWKSVRRLKTLAHGARR